MAKWLDRLALRDLAGDQLQAILSRQPTASDESAQKPRELAEEDRVYVHDAADRTLLLAASDELAGIASWPRSS